MYVGPLADAWVQAEVDKVMAVYRGRLSSADLAWMRERLLESLAIERSGAELLRRARPRFVEESGEVGADGRQSRHAGAEAESGAKRARGQGGRRR